MLNQADGAARGALKRPSPFNLDHTEVESTSALDDGDRLGNLGYNRRLTGAGRAG